MKKNTVLALMLSAALLLLAACSSNDTPTEVTPDAQPTQAVTEAPTAEPTEEPAAEPTEEPTAEPTEEPAAEPSEEPVAVPISGVLGSTTDDSEESTAEPASESAGENDPEIIGGADAETEIVVADGDEAAEETDASDPILATAYNGEIAVTLSDAQEDFKTSLATYVNMYTQYGYMIDEYDTEFRASVADETVRMLLSQRIVEHQATALGYELTEEKIADFVEQAETMMNSLREYYATYLAYYGYTGDDLDAVLEEELEASGYSVGLLYETLYLNDMLDYLYDIATADVTVSDEEVAAAYEAKLAIEQATYEDVDTYIDSFLSGVEILYTPEGLRTVQCIYFAPSVSDTDEAVATADEPDIATLSGAAKASAVRALIADGMDFIEAMNTYNEDSSTTEELATGYPVSADNLLYSDAFTEAAMALENIGDVSDVIVTDAGCFILRYTADLEPGSPALESRLEVETAEALETKKGEVFNAYTGTLIEEAGIEVIDLSPLYYFELEISYFTNTEATALTDMPEGNAVCELGAGAALDVLRRVEYNGTEYAFVTVFGTDYAGYLDASLLSEIDVRTKDNTDNSALVSAAPEAEAQSAYATVAEDCALTDMPEGDAVANLAAGASLEILGRIGMDGEEYVFAAVPGTAFKGYVNVVAIADADAEAALAADNATLAVAADVPVKLPTFTIVMANGSLIYGELYPDVTPESVGNFVELANSGYYDGVTFHRVIEGFMIQGGDPEGTGAGGPGYAITGEFSGNGVTNDLSHTRGVLSMARTNMPNTAGSQFFIVHQDSTYLDGQYAGFGMVLGGMETVDLIVAAPTDTSDKPLSAQSMRTVYVETYGQTYPFTKLED